MKQVQIRTALGAGWDNFKRRPWYLLGLTLAGFWLFAMGAGSGAFFTALSYIVYGGYLAMLLRHFAGEHLQFDDLFDVVDKRWVYFAFLGIIKSALIVLGFICFIVPGVYLTVRWMFAEINVIDKGMRPLEALKASSAMTEGVRWKLFLFLLVASLLVMLGTIAFLIGAIIVAIIVQFAVIKIYRDLEAAGNGEHHEEHHDEHHHEPHHHG